MPKQTGVEPERSRLRKITLLVPVALHRQARLAALWAQQPLYVLARQALERVVEDYRAQRQAEKIKEQSDAR